MDESGCLKRPVTERRVLRSVVLEYLPDGRHVSVDLIEGGEYGFAGTGWGEPYISESPVNCRDAVVAAMHVIELEFERLRQIERAAQLFVRVGTDTVTNFHDHEQWQAYIALKKLLTETGDTYPPYWTSETKGENSYLPYRKFQMRDYNREKGLLLVGLEYLEEMFTLDVTNTAGQPVKIVLLEKATSHKERENEAPEGTQTGQGL